ncbi:DUF732 domain-containing protein [Streptomyces sp. NPDC102279]|uniref:DUF732 domain-containing protein n=1 Tax=Streptomyces sp. NPDC102279 TaxID=3366153 RepID=UPI0038281EF0
MRTRTTVATLGVAGILALTGCTVDTDTTDSKPKMSPSAKADSHTNAENAFLIASRGKVPALKKIPDATLLEFGHTSCDAMDAGNTPLAVAMKAEENLQIGEANSGYLIGAAVAQLCPKHKSEI